jgi:hypothetical protein
LGISARGSEKGPAGFSGRGAKVLLEEQNGTYSATFHQQPLELGFSSAATRLAEESAYSLNAITGELRMHALRELGEAGLILSFLHKMG